MKHIQVHSKPLLIQPGSTRVDEHQNLRNLHAPAAPCPSLSSPPSSSPEPPQSPLSPAAQTLRSAAHQCRDPPRGSACQLAADPELTEDDAPPTPWDWSFRCCQQALGPIPLAPLVGQVGWVSPGGGPRCDSTAEGRCPPGCGWPGRGLRHRLSPHSSCLHLKSKVMTWSLQHFDQHIRGHEHSVDCRLFEPRQHAPKLAPMQPQGSQTLPCSRANCSIRTTRRAST